MLRKYYKLFYLLQLENYNLFRFVGSLKNKREFLKKEYRNSLVYTQKTKVLITLVILINIFYIILFLSLSSFLGIFGSILLILLFLKLNFFYPEIYIILSVSLFYPVDYLTKEIIFWRAKNKIRSLKNLTVIAIAGSYGKSTMKNFLSEAISSEVSLLTTRDNINTPMGISRQIIKELSSKHEYYIVEMGEYYRWDIRQISDIVNPKIGIITGINEAHIERLKTIDTTIDTIFELSNYVETIYLNKDDKNVLLGLEKYQKKLKSVELYSSVIDTDSKIQDFTFESEKLTNTLTILNKEKKSIKLDTKILGEYVIGLVDLTLKISNKLGIEEKNLISNIPRISPVEHRLQPIKSEKGIVIIDDSYNSNPEGFKSAIRILSKFTNRRKILITPGIVETGQYTKIIHEDLAEYIYENSSIDLLILVTTLGTKILSDKLLELGFPKEKIVKYSSSKEAFDSLNEHLKQNDVILFQNDISDNYF